MVGPAALISLMIASAIGQIAPASPEAYIQISVNLAMLVGLILMAMSALRLGSFAKLISSPVITGFTSASALIIAASQLNLVLGIEGEKGATFIDTISRMPASLASANLSVVLLSAMAFVILWAGKSLLPVLAKSLTCPIQPRLP